MVSKWTSSLASQARAHKPSSVDLIALRIADYVAVVNDDPNVNIRRDKLTERLICHIGGKRIGDNLSSQVKQI